MICSLCAGRHLPINCALGLAVIASEGLSYSLPPEHTSTGLGIVMAWDGHRWRSTPSNVIRLPKVQPSGQRAVPKPRLTVVGF